ncbi:MAG: DUF4926 domain-containing protein [Pyrinomonadaceae bacterium MAG19_C2-C3]|nr:DUF4926 domain-containing protein [Pyrinomonadaceae bacterium MAG19_C2-C3]
MGTGIKLLDVVALLEDLPDENLRRGEIGTVVEVFADKPDSNGAFLVEFSDEQGQAYSLASLRAAQFVVLHKQGKTWSIAA